MSITRINPKCDFDPKQNGSFIDFGKGLRFAAFNAGSKAVAANSRLVVDIDISSAEFKTVLSVVPTLGIGASTSAPGSTQIGGVNAYTDGQSTYQRFRCSLYNASGSSLNLYPNVLIIGIV
jgi:hypothetical protein